ncbi:MAG TPA: hypothetical protein VGM37_15405 [Armatimonadota bacterium]|jgi:hypothetical protein
MTARWTLALVAAAGFLAGAACHAQGMSSANYKIPTYVINSGGGVASSANYQLVASIGEPIIGPIGTTPPDNYKVDAGFLATLVQVIGMPGDVNADGVVDVEDVKMLLKVSGGLTDSSAASVSFSNGNVNPTTPDCCIHLDDAVKVLRYLRGLQPTLP